MTNEYIYHLTGKELRHLMIRAIAKWEQLDHNVTEAVDAALAEQADSQSERDTLLENSLPAIDEDEIFSDALKSDPPILCPNCGDSLSSLETDSYLNIWCLKCGYDSKDYFDNISPAELGLQPPF